MTAVKFDELLPTGAIERAAAVILANCGETVESVKGFALQTMLEVQRDALRAALFGDRPPFLVRDPRDNPRHGDVLELDGSRALVSGVLADYAIVTVEDADGNEVTSRPTREEFRRVYALWHVVRVAEYSTGGEP